MNLATDNPLLNRQFPGRWMSTKIPCCEFHLQNFLLEIDRFDINLYLFFPNYK